MIGPRLAEAAITAGEKPRPDFFFSSGPSVEESAAASETAVPETSERIAPASIATCARPPRTRPTSAFEKATICSMMPPLIISSPATMNSGIAISGNELTAAIMRCGSMLKSTFDIHSPPMAAAPSANASGMPSSPAARKNAITHQLMRASFDHLNGAHRLAPEELDEVQEAVRGGDCHRHHEPVGARIQRLHHLVPGELRHLERLPEHHHHQRRAAQRAGLGERAAQPGRYVGEEKLDADVRALADAQRNGEEHAPDEEESRDFLRPVDGGVEAIAQQHLQRHDADHQRARGDDRPAREPVHRVEDAGVELLQVLLLGVGDHPVDEVGADALLHVLDDTARPLAHLLPDLRPHLACGHPPLLYLADPLTFP